MNFRATKTIPVLLPAFLVLFVSTPSIGQEKTVIKPEVSSTLYKQLLSAIRPRVEFELKTKVKFKVHKMNVDGNWAYLEVVPLRMNGQYVDYSKTKFKNADLDLTDLQQKALLINYSMLKKVEHRWYEIRQESFQIRANINWGEYFPVKSALFGYE